MPTTILLVEDEPEIRELLVFTLQRAGFETIEAATAEHALRVLDDKRVGAAIIDWMLPGMSGVDLAYRIRQDDFTQALPLIMLTARGEEVDKLKSFDSGIDDYITKPFSPRELTARLKALLRRSGASQARVLDAAGITLDLDSHRLLIDGREQKIGPTEFRLLEFFITHPNRAFDRGQLLDHVWGRSVYIEERTVDVHVLRLRKILKPHGLEHLIQTVRGFGYRFSNDESTSSVSAR